MPIRRAVLITFLSLWGTSNAIAQDRSREMINLAYAWNPKNEFSALDASLGIEMFTFPGGRWSAVAAMRQADLNLNLIDSHIHLSNYGLSLPLMSRISKNWFLVASPKLSVKNASHSTILAGDTLYPSAAAIFNYRNVDQAGWTYSFGFFYSKEIEQHFFLPIVGAQYSYPPWRLNLGFPNFAAFYQPKANWEIGIKSNFDSSTYTLPETSDLKSANEKGLRVRIIDVGPALNFQVSKNLWLNTNLGVVLLAEGHTVSEHGTTRRLLYKGEHPLFLRVSLSFYPFDQKTVAVTTHE